MQTYRDPRRSWGVCGCVRRVEKAQRSSTTRRGCSIESASLLNLRSDSELAHSTRRPGERLFGALGDSAPDRWGRLLMRRAERMRADREGRQPRTLLETDFLLLVDDEARLGALRFAEHEGGPFLRLAASSVSRLWCN